jgi:hypothetical protein
MTQTESKSWFSASLRLAGDVGRHDCGVAVPSPVTAPYYPERLCSWPGNSGDNKLISHTVIFIVLDLLRIY